MQYIVRSGLFGGINLSVDKKTNTIKIEDLANTLNKHFGSQPSR